MRIIRPVVAGEHDPGTFASYRDIRAIRRRRRSVKPAAGDRRRSERAQSHLRSVCCQPQMDCGLLMCLDDRTLALRRRGHRSLLPRVVGWSMSAAMMAQLVTDALVMAICRRGKPDALLHRCDRGSQYTSEQFQRLRRSRCHLDPYTDRFNRWMC